MSQTLEKGMKLVAEVVYTKRVPTKKLPSAHNTLILIKFGSLTIASAKVGGRYSPEEALGEFRRNKFNGRFKYVGNGAEIAKSLK